MKVLSYIMTNNNNTEIRENIVLSILPNPVERILAGKKLFELRKQIPQRAFKGIFLYTTEKIRAFQAYAETIGYFRCDKDTLWKIVGEHATPKSRYNEYFREFTVGYAIALSRICKFSTPITFEQVKEVDKTFEVPIQFFYLEKTSSLASFLNDAISSGNWFETGVENMIRNPLAKFHDFRNH